LEIVMNKQLQFGSGLAGTRVTHLLVAAALSAASGAAAFGQVQQVYTGRVLDANPQVGAGGSNHPVPGYAPINGNNIITGNTTGLSYFHDRIPYSDPYAFQESLPSSSLNNFERQSAPLDYTSGQGVTQRPYYNPSSQTAGLAYNGQLAVAVPTGNGFDSKFSLNGASSVASSGHQYVPPKVEALGNPLQPLPLGVQAPAYNFESLASPGDFNEGRLSALYASQPQNPAGNDDVDRYTNKVQRAGAGNSDQNQINGKNGKSGQASNGDDAASDAKNAVDNNDQRISERVHGGAGQQALDQQISPNGGVGRKNIRPPADLYQQLMDQLAANQAKLKTVPAADGSKTTPGANTPAAIDPLTGQPVKVKNNGLGGAGTPGSDEGYQSTDPAAPNYRPASMMHQQTGADMQSTATLQSGRAIPPLATLAGLSHSAFDEAMARGEKQLRAGNFLRAADTYQAALQINPDNALALVGRAHAELGAGLVESAAYDLKFLWQRKPQLIAVHYDLGAFLPKKRLDYLKNDLNDLSKQGIPAASLLLAYVDYQQGETRDLISTLQYWRQRQADPWQDVLQKAWIDNNDSGAATQPAH
jgi:hypothetical protein